MVAKDFAQALLLVFAEAEHQEVLKQMQNAAKLLIDLVSLLEWHLSKPMSPGFERLTASAIMYPLLELGEVLSIKRAMVQQQQQAFEENLTRRT